MSGYRVVVEWSVVLDTLHCVTLILINGVPGSSKSAVCDELRARGFEAYDVDEDGFKSWYGKANDALAVDQPPWSQTTVEWRNRYWLKIERHKVEALAATAAARAGPTFLCGTGPNEKRSGTSSTRLSISPSRTGR